MVVTPTHEHVRRARLGRGMSLAEVARRARVSAVHLTRFERGLREMSSQKLDRVLTVLGLQVQPADGEHLSSDAGAMAPTP